MEAFTLFGLTITYAFIWKAVRIALYVVVGLPLIKIITRTAMRAMGGYGNQHVRMLLGKLVYYLGFFFILISVLNELGFQLSALLGAAGIFGVAIGFASQTSMSNLISGLFLLSEGFLAVGDQIKCSGVDGVVETIDLFSVKVRTFDNKLIRVPNERLIKDNLVNITYYPVRRAEIAISVPGDKDLQQVVSVINDVVNANSLVAKEPKHDIVFTSLSSSALHVTLRVWTNKKTFLELKQSLLPEIKTQLAQKDIKPLYVMVQ